MALQRKLDSGELSGFAILQNNHDSLLIECPVGTETAVAAVVQQHMNIQMTNPFGEAFGMESEASVGKNWYEMKPL
jgi:DNA polymerase I-like protein with 3'-5' exonuclease and polymerase domains